MRYRTKRRIRVLLLLAVPLLLLALLITFCSRSCEHHGEPGFTPEMIDTVSPPPEPTYFYGICIDSMYVEEGQIAQGQFLSTLFSSKGISPRVTDHIARNHKDVFDVGKIRADNRYYFLMSNDTLETPLFWIYEIDRRNYAIFSLTDSLTAWRFQKDLEVQLVPGSCLLPNFNVSTTQVALGSSVNFTDSSFGDIVSWSWAFEGGTPSTSTLQNPHGIVYNEVGDFDVTLTITDADGNSETLLREGYIHVRESYNMQDGTIETCNALFYDNGGPNNGYGNNKNYTMTFIPADQGNMIGATFSEFSTEAGYDFLYIYDGSSTDAMLIGTYDGTNSPGTVTATNDEGALTFRFTSDAWETSSGWAAQVYCISHPTLSVTVTADPEVINEGEKSQLNAVVTGGSGEYTFVWEPAETLDNPDIANPVAWPVNPETVYKVVVTDSEGNYGIGEVTVTIRDWSVNETISHPSIYPNPSHGNFTIQAQGEVKYELYNSLGQAIVSGQFNDNSHQINGENLNPGIYFLHLNCESGSFVEKIVIEK